MKYALSHEFGETYFETLRDAIMAMYIMADHVPECKTTFAQTEADITQISNKVNSGGYYEHGNFVLYATQ